MVGAEAAAEDPKDRPDLVFKTSDGYITAGTISDSEWQGFCRASGDPELAKDPRFATPSARSVNATARINKMGEYIATRIDRRMAGAARCRRRALRADPAPR